MEQKAKHSPSTRKRQNQGQSKENSKASDNASYRSSASKGKKLVMGKDSRAASGLHLIAMNKKMSENGSGGSIE